MKEIEIFKDEQVTRDYQKETEKIKIAWILKSENI